MAHQLVVGVDVLVQSYSECWHVQRWVKYVEEEEGKLRWHRLEERMPVCLGEIEVGVDLPPRHVVRRNVEYPPCLSEGTEVKVPREDDDVEKYWDEGEVCWLVSANRD